MIVFVDMDGVLANFVGRVAEILNSTPEEMIVPGVYNCVEGLGMTDPQMWEAIHDAGPFFETLDPYPWTHDLLYALQLRVDIDNVCLLTSPPKSAEAGGKCCAGKIMWIDKHLPEFSRRYLIGAPKQLCAWPGAVLIDDSELKIKRFEEAGGHGILFPARWNRLHSFWGEGFDPVAYILGAVDAILKQEVSV